MSSRRALAPGSPWPVAAWVLFGLALVGLGAGVAGSILSPTLVLDLVSLWPLAVPGVVALPLVRRFGRTHRQLALPPLLLLSWLVATLGLHAGGWAPLPSTSADWRGPELSGDDEVSLSVGLDGGSLEASAAASSVAYEIDVIPLGGEAGAPDVSELVEDGSIRALVAVRRDSAWFRFAGWRLRLTVGPRWSLDLAGAPLDADLAALDLDRLVLRGEGAVRLGTPARPAAVTVTGSFLVEVPASSAVRVVGSATVPAGWTEDAGGYRSPNTGAGWTVTVERGATLEIRTR